MFFKKKSVPRFYGLSSAFTEFFHRSMSTAEKAPPAPVLLQKLQEISAPKTRIYADTCTLLHDSGMNLLAAAEKLYKPSHGQQHLLILSSVMYELENVGKKDPSKAKRCAAVREKLKDMSRSGTVLFIQSSTPTFSDAGFISRFVAELQHDNIVLLTQDKALSDKVMALPTFLEGAVNRNHSIRVFKLTADGTLVPHETQKTKRREENSYEKQIYSKPVSLRPEPQRSKDPCRRPAFRQTDRLSGSGILCAGGSYPRFYAQNAGERSGRSGCKASGHHERSGYRSSPFQGWS